MSRWRCTRSNYSGAIGSRPCSYRSGTGQKTAKACREEWQANKAANQANGITEKAYVDSMSQRRCTPQTTAAPPPPPLLRPQRLPDKRPPRHAERNGRPIKLPIKPTE